MLALEQKAGQCQAKEAHHCSDGPDMGRNLEEGRQKTQLKKKAKRKYGRRPWETTDVMDLSL